MTCMNCVSKVKNGLETIDGVDRVEVSLKDSEATIYGEDIDVDKINGKVKQLGFG